MASLLACSIYLKLGAKGYIDIIHTCLKIPAKDKHSSLLLTNLEHQ
jgi:hypothetical protein